MSKRHRSKQNKRKITQILMSVDWVIALFGFILLVLVVGFIIFPFISKSMSMKAEMDELDQQIDNATNFLTQIRSLDDVALDADYKAAIEVVPARLEVASFASFVDATAQRYNLEFQEASTGNAAVAFSDTEKSKTNAVIGAYDTVSGPFVYEGGYMNIAKFLSEVQNTSKYLIIIDRVSMKSLDADGSRWEVRFIVTGYYKSGEDEILSPNPRKPFKPYTQYNEALQIIRRKARYGQGG